MRHKTISLLFFLILFGVVSKASDTIIITNESLNQEHFFHGRTMDLLEDKKGALTFTEILKAENQKKFFLDTIKVAADFNLNSYYWMRFTVLNKSSKIHNWVMELYDFKIDQFEVYIPDTKGGFIKKTGGSKYNFYSKDYFHKNFVFDIPQLPEQTSLTFYVKIYFEEPVGVIGVVRSQNRFVQYATMEYYLLALFYGVLLSVFFYNLFLYFTVKEKAYWFLVLYILGFGLYAMTRDGTGFQCFWPEFPLINKYASQFFLLVIMVSIILYAKEFLLTNTTTPVFNKWLNILIFLRIILFLLSFEYKNTFFFKVISYYDFITAFIIFAAGLYSYSIKKYIPARLYVIAFTFFFTGFFISMLHSLRWFDVGVYLAAYAFNGGVVLQIFFLSLSVGNRINLLIKEKEELKEVAKRELEEKVNERTSELQEKNRQLDSFVYKASHDIKGPLKSIIGLTTVALKDIDHERSREYFTHILKSTRRLDTLLHDLLNLTKMQQELPLKISAIDIEQSLNDIFISFNNIEDIETFNFELVNNYGAVFYSDSKIIHSVFQNLIENSIKYRDMNKPKAVLRITINKCDEGIEFVFKDNGVGIPSQHHEKIFEMFAKVNESSNGFGLGLHIVKQSLNKLGGSIKVESKDGEGTIFVIRLSGHPEVEEKVQKSEKTLC